jgi:phosphocarrier protein
MIESTILIQNKLGLHARAAAKLVQTASQFSSRIYVSRDDREVNAKSIMGVMMLAAAINTRIKISADGEDEAQALAALEALINDKFGEGQ